MINTLEILIERNKSPELLHLFVPDLDKLLEKKMDVTLDLELDLVNVKISQSVHHLPWKVSLEKECDNLLIYFSLV